MIDKESNNTTVYPQGRTNNVDWTTEFEKLRQDNSYTSFQDALSRCVNLSEANELIALVCRGSDEQLTGVATYLVTGYRRDPLLLGAVVTEVHDRLAKRGCKGEFEPWLRKLGIPKKSAYRLMRRYALYLSLPSALRSAAVDADIDLLKPSVQETLATLQAVIAEPNPTAEQVADWLHVLQDADEERDETNEIALEFTASDALPSTMPQSGNGASEQQTQPDLPRPCSIVLRYLGKDKEEFDQLETGLRVVYGTLNPSTTVLEALRHGRLEQDRIAAVAEIACRYSKRETAPTDALEPSEATQDGSHDDQPNTTTKNTSTSNDIQEDLI